MNAEAKTGRAEPDYDPGALRRQVAILSRELAWLDNAATTQRPEAVLRAMDEFSRRHNANTRRSVHQLGAEATAVYEGARERVAAFVSGYRKPDYPQTLFIWQVVTAHHYRGKGLGRLLIETILAEEAGFTALETTITADNQASWRLFESLSNKHAGALQSVPFFTRQEHFNHQHDTEHLVRIQFP